MKNKLILFSFIIIFIFSGVSIANAYSWSDLRKECFLEKAELKNPSQTIIKAESPQGGPFIFVQDNKFLLSRVYDYNLKSFYDYDVIETTGLEKNALNYLKFLNDNNYNTEIFFSPYSKSQKKIVVDFSRNIISGNFSFLLKFKGSYLAKYFISSDSSNYIQVKNVNNFDFRYLKIIFEPLSKDGVVNNKLSIQELNVKKTKSFVTYLLNSISNSDIDIYSSYQCNDKESLNKILNSLQADSRKISFTTDINTKKYLLNFADNPVYNNDFDGDGILNDKDNCIFYFNLNQSDLDGDLIGDACDFDNSVKNFYEKDSDGDQIGDQNDNCPYIYNPSQLDKNGDKKGDLCADDDRDGKIGFMDNCPYIYNPDQKDINVNNVGDACEFDKDKDGIFDSIDNCISIPNSAQNDKDLDGIGDKCDNCDIYNPRQIDKNNNGIGDKCEKLSQYKKENDKDKDGILDSDDNCISIPNPAQNDKDLDGIGDKCDNCPGIKNKKQIDLDDNSIGDMCEDSDNDGILGYLDNCMFYANPKQEDQDNDGIGNVCEDDDFDGIVTILDNCPNVSNKDQLDIDGDGIGNKCDNINNSFIESNKTMFYFFIIFITVIFAILIFFMVKKIKSSEDSVLKNNKEDELENDVDFGIK